MWILWNFDDACAWRNFSQQQKLYPDVTQPTTSKSLDSFRSFTQSQSLRTVHTETGFSLWVIALKPDLQPKSSQLQGHWFILEVRFTLLPSWLFHFLLLSQITLVDSLRTGNCPGLNWYVIQGVSLSCTWWCSLVQIYHDPDQNEVFTEDKWRKFFLKFFFQASHMWIGLDWQVIWGFPSGWK